MSGEDGSGQRAPWKYSTGKSSKIEGLFQALWGRMYIPEYCKKNNLNNSFWCGKNNRKEEEEEYGVTVPPTGQKRLNTIFGPNGSMGLTRFFDRTDEKDCVFRPG